MGHIDDFLEQAGEAGRRSILRERGGCVKVAQAADLLRSAKSAVETEIAAFRLIGAHVEDGEILLPVWQFCGAEVLPGVVEILAILRRRPGFSDMTPFIFFLQPLASLDDRSPIEALADGDFSDAEQAAWAFVE